MHTVQQVANMYRERGYTVEIEPVPGNLPPFLQGYHPDLIARGSNESVVVEVKVGTRSSAAETLRNVAERVSREPGWRFSLVFVDPSTKEWFEHQSPPIPVLERRLQDAALLESEGQREAAFLLFWSALEGVLRTLSDRLHLPLVSLPPSALIRELYSVGELSADHYETLITALPLRNELVHGLRTTTAIDTAPVHAVTRELLAEAKKVAS